ncbi:MAG: PTS sugar transporter subunit IIA [Spirochaetes bacterium]|nr:PTS sugar transporter subunit IIA [Spirochaetota bacterium]
MKLQHILNKDLIFINSEVNDYDGLLKFLSEKFAPFANIKAPHIYKKLQEREKLSSTYMGRSTAMPHNRIKDFKNILIAFVKLKTPIPVIHNSRQEEIKYIFSLLISPSEEKTYLNILSSISTIVTRHSEFLEKVRSEDEFMEGITSLDISIGKYINAEYLMQDDYPFVRENDSIRSTVDLMKSFQITFLPVVDKSGMLKGYIDLVDLIHATFPGYVFDLIDFSFLTDFPALEKFWGNEDKLKVSDFMSPPENIVINQETKYPEILFLISKHKKENLIVTDLKQKLIGVISIKQILNKMIRP